MTTPEFSSFTSLAQRLVVIIGELRGKVAAHGGRDRTMVPLLTLAWLRLGRMAKRFDALVARLVAGRPVAPSRPRIRAGRVAPRPAGDLRLPTRHAWLIRLTQETAQLGGHVQALLADPDMAALLAAAPGAGRILRPLCHMLAIDLPPVLALPGSAGTRAARAAPRIPRPKPPTANSLIWAVIEAQARAALAVVPDPGRRKPPWYAMIRSR